MNKFYAKHSHKKVYTQLLFTFLNFIFMPTELDDDLNRLVHQVYKGKSLNVESTGVKTVHHTYKSNRASDKEFFKRSTESDGIDILNDDTDRISLKNYESDDTERGVIGIYENDPVMDEYINEMTSTIIKSCLQYKGEEQGDMLASCWLWDFAGQKDYFATHQVFLSQHAVYLLVTDSLEFSITTNQGIDFEGSAGKLLN